MAAVIETSAKEVIEATEIAGTGDATRGDALPHNANSLGKERESRAEPSRRSEASENGKKKPKEDKPPTKVVIRRLPPSMTQEVFLDQISPIPDHDYFYYVQGDPSAGAHMGFSRAYINFLHQEDLFRFTETYDNYVFVDSKGQEYPAMVEFSLFQRIPKQRTKKKDPFAGSIETTTDFVAFKENLEAAAAEAAKPGVTSKQHFFETEVTSSAPLEETTTPLLEFLKQKRADRARIRDERREEKKRKEAERKLKLKATKERKENEEEPKEIKLLQPKEKKDGNNKETRNGRRSEKEKPPKENRTREFKNRNKNFSEEKGRLEKRDDKRKESGGPERKEEKKESQEKESKENVGENFEETTSIGVPDRAKPGGSDRKRGDRKKFDGEAPKVEGEDGAKKTRNRSVRKERERKRRDDYLAKKQLEKKNSAENGDMKRSRTFKSSSNEAGGSKKEKDDEKDCGNDARKDEDGCSRLKEEPEKKPEKDESSQNNRHTDEKTKRRNSLESKRQSNNASSNDPGASKRRSSLESGEANGYGRKENKERRQRKGSDKDKLDEKRGAESDGGDENSSRNLDDKACKSDQDENKEKDPRTGRRIRNKDRPSIQIYRPGMGKFSKQRLEKERPLGSSTEVDSPSHSPSPVPKSKPPPLPP